MNSVNLIGRIGNEVELFKTKDGKSVTKINLAVRRNKEVTDWFNLTAYGVVAELIHKHFAKRSMIGISGQLYTETYEKDGKKISSTKVFVNDITFIDSKKNESENDNQVILKKTNSFTKEEIYQKPDVEINISDDDLPF